MAQKLAGNTNRQRVRNVCFTLNNPALSLEDFADRLVDSRQVSYYVVGQEVGASGTAHFQGYVEFQSTVEWSSAHALLMKAHMELRRGTAEQARNYCQKDGSWTSHGEISQQGSRSDIQAVADAVRSGSSLTDIAMDFPVQFIKFHKGIGALQARCVVPRCAVPQVRVFHGGTGTGKSFRAREWLPNAYVWHPQQGTWFDGYEGQDEVIFEEFRGQIPFGMLLSLLDQYDCKVQFKGGMCEFAATKIAITSPLHPSEWFFALREEDRLDQLTRRCTEILRCTKNEVPEK